MAKANVKLTLSFLDPFRHIIPEIMHFPSHYSYELSVQLLPLSHFSLKKGTHLPEALQLSVFSAVSMLPSFLKLFPF